jgi:amyloid beta precursor protein binding protein 1
MPDGIIRRNKGILQKCHNILNALKIKDTEIIGRQNELIPSEILHEICRYGASEPHVIAAILGGTVAQEVIKLSTHQYIPVDNSLIFDGHSQQARTFRIKKH